MVKLEINTARKHIDRLDTALIAILAERMSLMPDIGEYKKKNGMPITDEKREIQIMDRLKSIAKEYGLEDGFVEEVFLSIFNEAKRIQSKVVEGKK